MPEPVVIRLPVGARIFQGVAFVGAAGFLVKAASDFHVPWLVVGVAVFAAAGARGASIVVRADNSGLFVRNLFTTRQIPWSQVERFGFGARPQSIGFERLVHAVLRDGELLPLDATRRGGKRERMQELVRRLQAWLDY